MTARKTAAKAQQGKRFAETLTEEQRALLRQSREDAERERPQIIAQARQDAADTAAVDAEIRRAFELLKGLRMLQKVSLAELAERTGIAKHDLSALESQPEPCVSLVMLVRYARALGKELRISLGDSTVNSRPARRRKPTAASR